MHRNDSRPMSCFKRAIPKRKCWRRKCDRSSKQLQLWQDCQRHPKEKERHHFRHFLHGRTRGALMRFVGGGKGTDVPLQKSSGRNLSGTEWCMMPLFRSRPTFSEIPWQALHEMSIPPPPSEQPWKRSRKRNASAADTKFRKAWPRPVQAFMSIGLVSTGMNTKS